MVAVYKRDKDCMAMTTEQQTRQTHMGKLKLRIDKITINYQIPINHKHNPQFETFQQNTVPDSIKCSTKVNKNKNQGLSIIGG